MHLLITSLSNYDFIVFFECCCKNASHFLLPDDDTFFKARYILGIMGFLGFANVYAMRVNLSVAIVAMIKNGSTNNDNHTGSSDCPVSYTNSTTPAVSTQRSHITTCFPDKFSEMQFNS